MDGWKAMALVELVQSVGLSDKKKEYQSEQIKIEVENAIINIHDHNDPRTNAFLRTSL